MHPPLNRKMSQRSDEIISVAILIDGLKHDEVSER